MSSFDLFVGGGIGGMVNPVLGPPSVDTSPYNYDHTYSDCALNTPQGSSWQYMFYDQSGALYTVPAGNWVMSHCCITTQQYTPSGTFFALLDGTGRPVIAANGDGAGNVILAHNTGSTASPVWVQLGTGASYHPFMAGTLGVIDLKVTIDAGGAHSADLLINSVLVQSSTFADSTLTANGLMGSQLGASGYGNLFFSQLLSRLNASTVTAHVQTVRATGVGTYSAWTGAYTQVNQPAVNDFNYNSTTSINQKQSYPQANVTVPVGYDISSVWNWLRGRNNGGTPGNIKSICISSGTEVDSADLAGINLGFGSLLARYDTDPHTSAAWTQSGFNAPVEFGFESDT